MAKHKSIRRQRAEQRAKLLDKNQTPRRRGKVPPLKGKKKFEICLWFILTNNLACSSLQAAVIAAALLDDLSTIVAKGEDEILSGKRKRLAKWGTLFSAAETAAWPGIGVEYRDEDASRDLPEALMDRARYLHANAKKIIEGADEAGRDWLARSAAALLGLCEFAKSNNGVGVKTTLDALATLGWKAKLLKVFWAYAELIPENLSKSTR